MSEGAAPPTVSIALATFNGAAYLEDQLASLAGQARLPDELVVCDDCSEDATNEILEKFSRDAPFPVKSFPNRHRLGPKGTFNRAISLCSGEFILLSDQDDVWLKEKVQRVEEVFRSNSSAQVVIHDLAIVDSHLNHTGTTQLQRIDQLRVPRTAHVTGSATALRSSVQSLVLPFPEVIRTYDAWIHAIGRTLGARVVIEDVLSLYRRHTDTETSAVSASWNLSRLLHAIRYTLSRPSDVIDGERFAWLHELERRLTSEDICRSLPDLDRHTAKGFIEKQLSATQARQQIIQTPGPRRWFRVAQAYRNGLYEEFGGPGSAVRDLMTFKHEE